MKNKTSFRQIRIIVKQPNAGKVRVIKRVDVKGKSERPDCCSDMVHPHVCIADQHRLRAENLGAAGCVTEEG